MTAATMSEDREPTASDRGDEGYEGEYSRHERLVLGALAVAIFLIAWETISRAGTLAPIFMSSPTAIGAAAQRMWASGELAEHLRVSGVEFFWGYLLAVVTGVPLGLATGWYRRLNFVLDPFLSAFNATPRVALLPLIILWIGVGLWSKVAVIFLGAIFPIWMNVNAGVKTVEHVYLRVARSFLADDARIFRTIVLPSCVPFILAGMRLAVGRALVGVVVGELYAASAGVGFLIIVAGATFQTDKVFVGIGIIAAFGVLCNELLSKAERKFESWRPKVGAAQ